MTTPEPHRATGALAIQWESSERYRLLESIAARWDDHPADARFWQALHQASYLHDGKPRRMPGEDASQRRERKRLVKERKRLLRALRDYDIAHTHWFNGAGA
jgi:alpha-amylase/alpha-mannosidase (GH57 family)